MFVPATDSRVLLYLVIVNHSLRGAAGIARYAGRPRYFQLSTVGRRRTLVKMGTNSPVFQSSQ